MRAARIFQGLFFGLCLLSLTGCMALLSLYHKPGNTVHIRFADENGLMLNYTHSWEGELDAAIMIANQKCAEYGKVARMVSAPVAYNLDQSLVRFECLKRS